MRKTSEMVANQLIIIISWLATILPISPNLQDKRRKVRLRNDIENYVVYCAVIAFSIIFYLLYFKDIGQGLTNIIAYIIDIKYLQLDNCIREGLVLFGGKKESFIDSGYHTIGHLIIAITIPVAIVKLFNKFQETKQWRYWGYFGCIVCALICHQMLRVLGAINPTVNEGLFFQLLNVVALVICGTYLGIIFIKQDHFKESQELKIKQAELEKVRLALKNADLQKEKDAAQIREVQREIRNLTPFGLNEATDSFVVSAKMWGRYRPYEAAGVSNKSVLIKLNQGDTPLEEDSFRNRTLESIEIVAPFFRVHDSFIVNEKRVTAVIGTANSFYIVIDGWYPIKSTKRSFDQYPDALKCQKRPTEKNISPKYEELLRNKFGENIAQYQERCKLFDSILTSVFSPQKRPNDI